jgi:hypothetical protein
MEKGADERRIGKGELAMESDVLESVEGKRSRKTLRVRRFKGQGEQARVANLHQSRNSHALRQVVCAAHRSRLGDNTACCPPSNWLLLPVDDVDTVSEGDPKPNAPRLSTPSPKDSRLAVFDMSKFGTIVLGPAGAGSCWLTDFSGQGT